jgi:hypothetical protein
MRRISLVLALALVACGGPKKHEDEFPVPDGPPDAGATVTEPAATELPPALVAKVEHALDFVESFAVAAEANTADCAAMGTSLQALADGPDGKVLIAMDADPDFQPNAQAIADRFGPRLTELGDRISAAIRPCNTPEVNDALTAVGLQ